MGLLDAIQTLMQKLVERLEETDVKRFATEGFESGRRLHGPRMGMPQRLSGRLRTLKKLGELGASTQP
ncbi:MAG: hypothetical protein ACTSWP_07620 [Candidatus Freyarchaeota archaeon]|nr:hypothetical protein [Candidatus Freyrarchaeum guaymaensis]